MAKTENRNPKILLVCLLLAGAVILLFGRTFHYEFVNYDDDEYVYDNPAIRAGLSLKGIAWAFTHTVSGNWQPLAIISHMLDCRLYGMWPGGHHLTSVLLHAVAAILLFLVLLEMTAALWRSAFVAAVFAIHPLRAESVAWVSERKDVLSGVFFMLTLWAYVRYARGTSPSIRRYPLVVLCFALGLMSKPTLVTLPFVLLLLDYWPLNRFAPSALENRKSKIGNTAHLLYEKFPLFALSAASCVVTVIAQGDAVKLNEPLPLSLRLGNVAVSYAAYIGQMICPSGLAVFYPVPKSLPIWEVTLALLMLAAVTAGAFYCRKKQPWLLVGWLWYLGILVPMIGLMREGGKARADRYTYLSEIGLYLMITWGIANWIPVRAREWRRPALTVAAAGVIVALFLRANLQVSCWQNSETLWKQTLASTSGNSLAHYDLANYLSRSGRMDESIAQYREAIAIRPGDASIWNNLGDALFKTGRTDAAIGCYQSAVKIAPDFPDVHNNLGAALLRRGDVEYAIAEFRVATEIQPGVAAPWYNLGNALAQSGRVDGAIDSYQKALKLRPDVADLRNNLGDALLHAGRLVDAIEQFEEAVKIAPGNAQVRYSLGNARFANGQIGEAIAEYEVALQLQPRFPGAQNNLAWILATNPEASIRNGSRAIDLALAAEQQAGEKNPIVLRTLAAAYAESGRFPEATETARRALELAGAPAQAAIAEALRMQLKLYEAGAPYRDAGQAAPSR